ncbi:UNVERIFIED_CONTAM: hypothetical protein ABID98_001752 [Brevibacillus sp. OAP136]
MRKTLYVRVVLTFLAAILIAIVASTLIGLALFENELDHLQRDEIVLLGENIIHVYEQTTPANLASFMQSISKITSNPICVYSDSEEICAPRQATGRIPPETVRIVLSGERYLPAADADLAFHRPPVSRKGEIACFVFIAIIEKRRYDHPFVFDGSASRPHHRKHVHPHCRQVSRTAHQSIDASNQTAGKGPL